MQEQSAHASSDAGLQLVGMGESRTAPFAMFLPQRPYISSGGSLLRLLTYPCEPDGTLATTTTLTTLLHMQQLDHLGQGEPPFSCTIHMYIAALIHSLVNS